MGQRVRKTHAGLSGGAELYMYDEAGMLIGRYSATGQALEEFVYLEGRPVAGLRDFIDPIELEVYPILTDHLGTPRKVLDSSGQAFWSWDTKDPYGNQRPNEYANGGSTPFTFNLRFPGQWFDAETGLFHNGFRDYSPKLGRYIQADPIGLAGGMNSYAYVGSNPLNGVDPWGLKKINLFLESHDAALYRASETTSDIPGAFLVFSHGNANGISPSTDGGLMSFDAILTILKANGWKAGDPIVLYSCSTGRSDGDRAPFAQTLASRTGSVVIAPTQGLWVSGDGEWKGIHEILREPTLGTYIEGGARQLLKMDPPPNPEFNIRMGEQGHWKKFTPVGTQQ